MNKIILFIFFVSITCFAQARIVYNKKLKERISSEKVKKIFTGRLLYWEDGSRIFPCTVSIDSSPAIVGFLSSNVNMDKQEYLMHWRRILFSGKGYPPASLDGPADVLDFVSKNKSAIGIVDKLPARLPKNVQVLK